MKETRTLLNDEQQGIPIVSYRFLAELGFEKKGLYIIEKYSAW